MIYLKQITTPAQTYRDNPMETVLPVSKGLVYKVELKFPAGSTGLLGVEIFDGSHQVWPSSPSQWFTGDDDVISYDDTYLKLSPPYELQIKTYNDDDYYDHLFILRLGLVSDKIFMARFLPTYTYDYFLELQKAAEDEQERLRDELAKNGFGWVV